MKFSANLPFRIPRGVTLFFFRAGQPIFSVIIVALISNRLENIEFAHILYILSVTLVSGYVFVFGLDMLMMSEMGKAQHQVEAGESQVRTLVVVFIQLWAAFGLTVWLTWQTYGGVPILSGFHVPIAMIMLWMFLSSAQTLQGAALLGAGYSNSSFFYNGLLSTLLTLLLVAVHLWAHLGMDATRLSLLYLCGLGVSFAGAQWKLYRVLDTSDETVDFLAIFKLWRSILPSAATNYLTIFVTQMPFWLIVRYGDPLAVINYGWAFRFVSPLALVIVAGAALVTPVISRAYQAGNLHESEHAIRRNTTFTFAAALVTSLGILIVAPLFFRYGLGRSGEGLVPILIWLLAGVCIQGFTGTAMTLLRLCGRHQEAFWITIGAIFVHLVTAYYLMMVDGSRGVALSVAIYNLFVSVVSRVLVRKQFGVTTEAFLSPGKWREMSNIKT